MITKNKKLIIVGDSAFAEIAYEYFLHDSEFIPVAFSVEKDFKRKDSLFSLPVEELENLEDKYSTDHYIFVALTYHNFNRTRERLLNSAKNKGFKIASYVSSKAFVWSNVQLGENCFIFEDNTIQPFVSIGDNVILWSGNHIGHHSKIGSHCFISSHVVISGFCGVGDYSFLGVNAALSNNINLAKDNFIAMGAVILSDTEENKVYVGNPAKAMKGKASDMKFFK